MRLFPQLAAAALLLSAPILGLLINHQLFVRRPERGHHWRAAGTRAGVPHFWDIILCLKKTFDKSVVPGTVCTLYSIPFHV